MAGGIARKRSGDHSMLAANSDSDSAGDSRTIRTHSDKHAPRGFDALRVDPAVAAGKQRRDRTAYVVRQTDATERGLRRDEGVEFGVVAHRTATEVGFDRAGRERVDRDAARAELLRQIACQNLDAALHRGVGRVARQAEARQAAGDVDDAIAALLSSGNGWVNAQRIEASGGMFV